MNLDTPTFYAWMRGLASDWMLSGEIHAGMSLADIIEQAPLAAEELLSAFPAHKRAFLKGMDRAQKTNAAGTLYVSDSDWKGLLCDAFTSIDSLHTDGEIYEAWAKKFPIDHIAEMCGKTSTEAMEIVCKRSRELYPDADEPLLLVTAEFMRKLHEVKRLLGAL